jgi:hypothetical protein
VQESTDIPNKTVESPRDQNRFTAGGHHPSTTRLLGASQKRKSSHLPHLSSCGRRHKAVDLPSLHHSTVLRPQSQIPHPVFPPVAAATRRWIFLLCTIPRSCDRSHKCRIPSFTCSPESPRRRKTVDFSHPSLVVITPRSCDRGHTPCRASSRSFSFQFQVPSFQSPVFRQRRIRQFAVSANVWRTSLFSFMRTSHFIRTSHE